MKLTYLFKDGSWCVRSKYLLTAFMIICFSTSMATGGRQLPSINKPLDIVFCIDLSGSTNGLINDLRDNLWLIVNQAQQMEPAPDLRIGVIGFSRPSFGKESAYVKILSPLTRHFDMIEMELNKLRPSIEKGDQIVSEAIRVAVNGMKWSDQPDAVKMIYLVGNGMVTANGYEYVKYCEQAYAKNIPIHVLYVKKSKNWFKEMPGYRRIAGMTNGIQTEITINKVDEVKIWGAVTTDFESLNAKLNATYYWTGTDSSMCRKAMTSADSGAFATAREIWLHRMYFKSSKAFQEMYKDCDYLSGSLSQTPDPSAPNTDTFLIQIKEIYKVREQTGELIRKEFPVERMKEVQKSYVDGQMPENGIFHRTVMNILYRSWGLR